MKPSTTQCNNFLEEYHKRQRYHQHMTEINDVAVLICDVREDKIYDVILIYITDPTYVVPVILSLLVYFSI
jgi:hypothetical protein